VPCFSSFFLRSRTRQPCSLFMSVVTVASAKKQFIPDRPSSLSIFSQTAAGGAFPKQNGTQRATNEKHVCRRKGNSAFGLKRSSVDTKKKTFTERKTVEQKTKRTQCGFLTPRLHAQRFSVHPRKADQIAFFFVGRKKQTEGEREKTERMKGEKEGESGGGRKQQKKPKQ
jgi:hypothetical protein